MEFVYLLETVYTHNYDDQQTKGRLIGIREKRPDRLNWHAGTSLADQEIRSRALKRQLKAA